MNALKRMGATAAEIKRGAAAKQQEEERRAKELEEERQGKAAPPAAKAKPAAKPVREPLTAQIIKDLIAPKSGNRIRFDSHPGPVGLGIRITANGHRAFVFSYTVRHTGKERRYTIGPFPSWSIADARKEAKRLRREVDLGNDPLADIAAARDAETVADLIARFDSEHLSNREKTRASTAADYRRMIRVHIAPALQKLKVADVTYNDISALHTKVTKAGHRVRANACIRVCSKMFSLAIRWGMRADNPCKGIEKNKEYKRLRYLKDDELPRLLAALASHPKKENADVIRLLTFTGARRGEALGMRWADVDLIAGTWSKPASSTKQKEDHEVPLSAPVKQLLTEIRDQQSRNKRALPEHVFSGAGTGRHVVDIKRSWAAITKAAGLENLRVHDLRHSFASELVSGGKSLALVGALLGHSDPSTTMRYAHLKMSPQRDAVEQVGAVIVAADAGRKVARRRAS